MNFIKRILSLFEKKQSKVANNGVGSNIPKDVIMSVGKIVLSDRLLTSQEDWENIEETEVMLGSLSSVDIKEGVGAVVITDSGSGTVVNKPPFLNAKFNVYNEASLTINKNILFTTNEYKIVDDGFSKSFVFLVDMENEKGTAYRELKIKK